jgi:hypothetical protein
MGRPAPDPPFSVADEFRVRREGMFHNMPGFGWDYIVPANVLNVPIIP